MSNPGVANTNNRAFTVSSFFSYYMFHPVDAPTERERKVCFWASTALFILSLGLVHLACRICLYDRKITAVSSPNNLEKKTGEVFLSKQGTSNTQKNTVDNKPLLVKDGKSVVVTAHKQQKTEAIVTIEEKKQNNNVSITGGNDSSRLKYFNAESHSDKKLERNSHLAKETEIKPEKRHKHRRLHNFTHPSKWKIFQKKGEKDNKKIKVNI